jgi:hypothetical protein
VEIFFIDKHIILSGGRSQTAKASNFLRNYVNGLDIPQEKEDEKSAEVDDNHFHETPQAKPKEKDYKIKLHKKEENPFAYDQIRESRHELETEFDVIISFTIYEDIML